MTARQCAVLVVALTLCGTAICHSGSSAGKGRAPAGIDIHGAGATFLAPLYKKWLEEYHKRYPQVLVSYDPIGSGEGTKKFMAGAVDFGASEAAMTRLLQGYSCRRENN
jgi:phosphate transport system substrate-binding protein